MSRSRLLRRALRDRFLVATHSGATFEGVLLAADPGHLVLADAAQLAPGTGDRVKVDGELWLPCDQVAYLQRPGG